MTRQAPSSGWRHYWHENRLAACAPENPDSAAAIEAHWSAFFQALPTGTRLLDIATGNGVVLLWAARAARAVQRELQLTGIDSAAIDPARFLTDHQAELASARFIGNTQAESLPFADDSFDVVVSQYGLEYADLEEALSEAARVLVPGGQLHCLAHSGDSAVVGQGRAQLVDIDLLLAADGPFAAMDVFLQAQLRGRKVERATRQLTDALRVAEAHCAAHPSATLVRKLCAGILDTANRFEHYRPDDIERWMHENRKRLRDQRQRILDLQAARLTPERLAKLETILSSECWSALAISSLKVSDTGVCVGRIVSAVRR